MNERMGKWIETNVCINQAMKILSNKKCESKVSA